MFKTVYPCTFVYLWLTYTTKMTHLEDQFDYIIKLILVTQKKVMLEKSWVLRKFLRIANTDCSLGLQIIPETNSC